MRRLPGGVGKRLGFREEGGGDCWVTWDERDGDHEKVVAGETRLVRKGLFLNLKALKK
jgi:hypothetical protein